MGQRGLIRLVTQFDPPTARPAYATPSCSSSCCCCCCVGTAVASLSFTAVNAYSVAEREERSVGVRWAAGILGALALPASLGLAFLFESAAWVLIWPIVLLAAYLAAQQRLFDALGRTCLVVILSLVAALVELALAAAFLSTAGLIVELVLGLVVAVAMFGFARRW
jgi:O-antigen/teichoic acid export membrane protein